MSTQHTVYTDKDRVADLLLWEADPGQRYCRKAVNIKNTLGSTVDGGTVGVGYPLNNNGGTWELCAAAGVNSADGILVDNEFVPSLANNATTTRKYSVLVRGPALINVDALPTTDAVGAAITQSALVTQLATLGIQAQYEPDNTEVGGAG